MILPPAVPGLPAPALLPAAHLAVPVRSSMRDFRGIPRAEQLAFDYPMTGQCESCAAPVSKAGPGRPWTHQEEVPRGAALGA
jgi:hypothetical protein